MMKTIIYRGGLLTFKLPISWVEKHGDDAGAAFFSPTLASGILSLSVLTFKTSYEASTEVALKVCSQSKEHKNNQVIVLPNGNALSKYNEFDESKNIVLYNWEIANPLPSKHIRLAIFCYQVSKHHFEIESVQSEISMLNREIMSAEFASDGFSR